MFYSVISWESIINVKSVTYGETLLSGLSLVLKSLSGYCDVSLKNGSSFSVCFVDADFSLLGFNVSFDDGFNPTISITDTHSSELNHHQVTCADQDFLY